MLFNSFPFLLFFLIVTPLYYLTPYRWRWLLLLIASCYFYASFIPAYLLILFTIIGIDYIAGRCIENATGPRRRSFLILSLAANLGALALFKYYNFFIGNVDHLLTLCHIQPPSFPLWRLALPLGLSFHTFQAMSYTIEVYKDRQKAERHLGIYALYVMFYPQLVAGPIERPAQLLPQLHTAHRPDYTGIADGLKKMLIGFFLKVVIADRLAIYVNYVYTHPEAHSRLALLIAVLFFAFQIYCDFAGYSLIAIGSAKTMGFTLAPNFNLPLLSRSVIDYWRRWHITLSTWFNDYLFTPIVIEKRHWGRWAVVYGLFITFFFSGLWHGAAWTFVIWGLLHALVMAIELLTSRWKLKPTRPAYKRLLAITRWLITFSFLCFAWIFFRATSLHQAFTVIGGITVRPVIGQAPEEFREHALLLYCFFGIACISLADLKAKFYPEKHFFLYHPRPAIRLIACTTLIVLILLLGVFNGSQFIYFQF
jgi:D-alanyl-lipoteichoic acid acyltransferase DltB (MBOAT superfamily)